jgi:hypothetical protein
LKMLYERGKLLSAGLTAISVVVAFGAVADMWKVASPFVNPAIVAAALSAAGAAISIGLSRRLTHERGKGRVFIIYAREDMEAAQRLTRQLRESGFKPWLDVDELKPGQNWRAAIAQQIERSAAAVVIVSKNLSKRGYVQSEVQQALDVMQSYSPGFSPVLTVRIDDSEPPERLRLLQWVDLRDDAGFATLRDALRQTLRLATA